MIHTLIFAGGTGTRMKNEEIPKQFIEVDGVPIIIRTLVHFENHRLVDDIVVVCLESWIHEMMKLIEKYKLNKIVKVIAGGQTGYESIHNGLVEISKFANLEDIVLICDGVRPVLSEKLISNCIDITKKYGTAVPVVPSIDSVLISEDGQNCSRNMPKKEIYITQAPQGYRLNKIINAHKKAEECCKTNTVSSADLMIELGEEIKIFIGDRENIKVTTPEDLHTLRSHYYYCRYKKFAEEELKYGL